VPRSDCRPPAVCCSGNESSMVCTISLLLNNLFGQIANIELSCTLNVIRLFPHDLDLGIGKALALCHLEQRVHGTS